MKYIITESQLETIKDNILKIPFSSFNDNWYLLQKFLNKRENPPYILKGNVYLSDNKEITTLGSLISVEGELDLRESSIQSLGSLTSVGLWMNLYGTPIKSLGNLTSVGDSLNLIATTIKSLGNLTYVGGSLGLDGTPVSKKYSESEIRDMVKVGGKIYL